MRTQVTTLYREELDAAECGQPGCDKDHSAMFVHASCHPGQGIDACYDRRKGTVTFACHRCAGALFAIAVASKPATVH
jgi:hypothetical protein